MNIAQLKGEKTVKTLAKRLLAEPSKKTKKTTDAEMEAALLRLNPQLSHIRDLEEGTPILVPDEFAVAADESFTPLRGLTEALLRQAEEAVSGVRAVLKERIARSAEETDRVKSWLETDKAKEFLRRSPDLKQVFSGAATAVKTLAKEQASVLSTEDSALGKVRSQLAAFRAK